MTIELFFGYWIFAFIFAYAVQVVISGLRGIFPQEWRRLKIDFKNND